MTESNVFDETVNDLKNLLYNTLPKQDDNIEKEQEQPHFIAVFTNNPGGNSPKQVKEEYDYSINQELYKKKNSQNQPLAYELLEKYIAQISNKIVVVSEDVNLPSCTINAYFKKDSVTTVYISNAPNVVNNPSSNVIYLGIDKNLLSDQSLFNLDESLATYFTLQKINQTGIQKVCNIIKNMLQDKKIHLVIDLRIIDQIIAPSAKRSPLQKNYLSIKDVVETIKHLKNILYLDVIGFDESLDNSSFKYTKITGEVCRVIIRSIFNIKEKSMNIFTEDSRFLIYRPVEQITNDDIGWYIVKFLTIKEREIFLKHLIDNVATISIPDVEKGIDIEVYVTSTSAQEQNQKSFYTAKDMSDYCLFPNEKISMIFELLNTEKIPV